MNAADETGSGFLSRWSRRKLQTRDGTPPTEAIPAVVTPPARAPSPVAQGLSPGAQLTPGVQLIAEDAVPAPAGTPTTVPATAAPPPPPPTLADVAQLTRESDFSRFVAPGVDSNVKNAALQKLFTDPRFNVMDGLDTYIDDYSKPDPLPLASLRKMAQAAFLGLAPPEPAPAPQPDQPCATNAQAAATPTAPSDAPDATIVGAPLTAPDENADLRLQSHDAAGCDGAETSAAADRHIEP